MVSARIEGNVPHVYTGMLEILKHLSVEKNGTLPGNMGGKAYITAVDASAEVKRQFVANGLVFFPNEKVVKHEVIQFKDRLNIAVVVEGSYRIVSTVDGSAEEVSGVGDGLATGTAVASNIASTNALKNALLRTFLITEQSVEDAAKNEANGTPPATKDQRTIAAAKAPAGKPAAAGDPLSAAKAKIQAWIGGDETNRLTVNAAMETFKAEGKTGLPLYEAIVKEVGA